VVVGGRAQLRESLPIKDRGVLPLCHATNLPYPCYIQRLTYIQRLNYCTEQITRQHRYLMTSTVDVR